MDKMKNILWLLMFAGGVAHASDWQVISGSDKLSVFVDKSSISHTGKYRKAWFMYSNNSDQPGVSATNYKAYRSSKALEYFDCEERKNGEIQATYYVGEFGAGESAGSVVWKLPQVSFSEVVPDTIGETMLNYVCKAVQEKSSKLGKI